LVAEARPGYREQNVADVRRQPVYLPDATPEDVLECAGGDKGGVRQRL